LRPVTYEVVLVLRVFRHLGMDVRSVSIKAATGPSATVHLALGDPIKLPVSLIHR
jgi:acetolactate synthase regulatory subunit